MQSNDHIAIIRDEPGVRAMLHQIIEITDANTRALGFLARAVYEDAMARGRLWVAIDPAGVFVARERTTQAG